MFDTTTSQHIMMVRRLNASAYKSTPSTPEGWGPGWGWGWRFTSVRLRVHDVRVWECWDTLFSRITQPKINCNENTNNDKCSLPVIVAESLFDIVVIIGKASNCSPERHLASLLFHQLQFQAQNDTRRTAAPARAALSGVEGLTYICGTMSWFSAANSLLEFLRLIIQHHGVWNRGRISSLILTTSVRRIAHDSRRKGCHNFVNHRKSSQAIIHNTRRRTPLASARGFALPEMTYTALRNCIACFGRILRGVPRPMISFTITLYLVRMKKK